MSKRKPTRSGVHLVIPTKHMIDVIAPRIAVGAFRAPHMTTACDLYLGALTESLHGQTTWTHPGIERCRFTSPVAAAVLRWHRFRCEGRVGLVEAGLHVLHKCDVASCVNPHHLYFGTQEDNIRDLHERGSSTRRGLTHAVATAQVLNRRYRGLPLGKALETYLRTHRIPGI